MIAFKPEKILTIVAHPDDEVLGAGGTLAHFGSAGVHIEVVFCATGITGRSAIGKSTSMSNVAVESLRSDAEAACEILGVKKAHFLALPDNRLDTVSRADLSYILKDIQFSLKPDLVLTHHYGDYNWDHTIVFEATQMACRVNPGDAYPTTLMTFEVPSSTERAFQTPSAVFCPNVFFDVTKTFKKKIAAMQCYQSERREYPHARSPEALEVLAKRRGIEAGGGLAEAFQLVRALL